MARASSSWYWGWRSRFSSSGLLMKAVSTSTDGTSGERSTAKLACSTLALCSRPIWPSSASTRLASTLLSRICEVV